VAKLHPDVLKNFSGDMRSYLSDLFKHVPPENRVELMDRLIKYCNDLKDGFLGEVPDILPYETGESI